jgi:hypothetical protein
MLIAPLPLLDAIPRTSITYRSPRLLHTSLLQSLF